MPINFPTNPNTSDKFTFKGKTWNFNGTAWDRVSADGDVDSIASGTGGYVAFYTPEGVAGSTIGPAAEVLFWDDTNNRLGIGTTGPTDALDVRGGITASGRIYVAQGITCDGGATFGGDVYAENFFVPEDGVMGIGTNTTRLFFDEAGGKVALKGSEFFDVQQYIRHVDNEGTNIRFDGDSIFLKSTSYKNVLEAHKDYLKVFPGLSADGGVVASGATFGGDVIFQGNLLLPEDGELGIGGDTERIVFNGQGSGSSSIDIKCSNVDFGVGSGSALRSHGDSDTLLKFENDKHGAGNDGLELQQSGNVMIDVGPGYVNTAGATFGAGGATFSGLIHAHGITLGVGGITFADGTTQTTAFRAGLRYTVTGTSVSDVPLPGGVVMVSNLSGTAIDILGINAEDANGNNIDSVLDLYAANGGLIQILKEDGSELVIVATEADETSEASVSSDGASGTRLTVTETSGMEVDTTPSVGDVVYVYVIPNLVSAVQTIGGQQGNIQVETGFGLSMGVIANVGYLRVNPHHHFDFQGAEFSQTSNFAQGVTVGTDLNVAGSIIHVGDTNTKITYGADSITLTAGGTDYQAITSAGTNFADTDVVRPNLKDYSETVNAIGSVNSNTEVDFSAGNVQTVTVGGNCEFSFGNPPASGKAGTLTLIITNGGGHTVTFASAVKWPSDVAPSLSGSNGIDILSFITTDGGTNIYGFVGGLNFS